MSEHELAAEHRETPDVVTASSDYARRFEGEVGEWFLRTQSEAVRELLAGIPPGEPILEVGGAHAQLVPAIVESGSPLVVYGSPEATRERLAGWLESGQCVFVAGDLQRLPFADRTFGAVICVRQLAHLKRWPAMIGELCRVSDGRVVIDYASRRSVNLASGLLFAAKRQIEGDTRTFRLHGPRQIRGAFEAEGFEVVASRRQFLWPMVLHRALAHPGLSRLLEGPGRAVGLARLFGSPVLVRADRRCAATVAGRGQPMA